MQRDRHECFDVLRVKCSAKLENRAEQGSQADIDGTEGNWVYEHGA